MLKLTSLLVLTLCLFNNAQAQSQDPVFMDMDDAELTAPTPVTDENLLQNIQDARDDYQQAIIDPKKIPLHVVMDITRPDGEAKIYKFGELVNSYKIHGGLNKAVRNGKGQLTCAFTTTGRLLPTGLDMHKTSAENGNAPMPFYVELDEQRGVGAHQGNIGAGQYSHACIRQSRDSAKWLYGEVEKVSKMQGGRIVETGAIFDIVDNTPGVDEAKRDCLAKCRSGKSYCATPHLFDGDRPVRELRTSEFKRLLPSLLAESMRMNQHPLPKPTK